MAKNVYSLKKELRQLKFDNDLLQKIDCSKSDCKKYLQMLKNGEKLPDGVFQETYDGEPTNFFYTIYESDLTEAEKSEYFLLNQLMGIKYICTIKNCVVFFTVLSIISLILSFIFLVLNG